MSCVRPGSASRQVAQTRPGAARASARRLKQGAVAAGMLLLRVSLNITGSSLGDVLSERSSVGGGEGKNDEPIKAVRLRRSGGGGVDDDDDDDELIRAASDAQSKAAAGSLLSRQCKPRIDIAGPSLISTDSPHAVSYTHLTLPTTGVV